MVWSVPWLPDEGNGYVITGKYDQLVNTKVSNLMLTGGREWDSELLEDLFVARDRDLIKRIPLSVQVTNDSWYWLYDEKGEYTVRSCYRFGL